MPSDEGIKIWVGISCDKGTSPVNLHIFTIPNSTPVVANKQHTRGRERQIDTESDREKYRPSDREIDSLHNNIVIVTFTPSDLRSDIA